MKQFHSTLLREKFLIKEAGDSVSSDSDQVAPPVAAQGTAQVTAQVTAMSNRMVLPFRDSHGRVIEEFVVRAKTMHSCVKLAREIVSEFMHNGGLTPRIEKMPWSRLWGRVMTQAEKKSDPDHWCVIYKDGRPIFEDKSHHPFLDVIEKVSFKHQCDYDESIVLAEKAFLDAGKKVTITHDGKIAAILDVNEERAKCGIIIRSPIKTTTCNIRVQQKHKDEGYVLPAFALCAQFLEGIHLSFSIGHHETIIANADKAQRQNSERAVSKAKERILSIQRRIGDIEDLTEVNYRPEKPSFKSIIRDTMDFKG